MSGSETAIPENPDRAVTESPTLAIVHPEPCASTDLTHAFDHEVIAKAAEQIERLRTLLYEFDLYSFEIPGYLDSPFAAEVRATLGDRGDFGRDGVPS